ncbi:ATP-binding response regulator [Egbenema bharatensis]|uniref:ATP-binding response regulator n=1 Tax=Egbenema bharatensis TaxID=3463334 RepID=UPI003A89F789
MSRILLLLSQPQNRRLLADWLSQRHQVIIPELTDMADPLDPEARTLDQICTEPFDLGILDGFMLMRLEQVIQAKRDEVQPIFLPFILVTAHQRVKLLTAEVWRSVDDVILSPVEKLELQARVEVLLRSRQLSLSLQSANDRLLELNDLKTRFIGMASHEFRNPITAIVAAVRLLELDDLPADRKQRFLQIIDDSARRMTRLLDDVLILTRGELSSKPFRPTLVDLADFCQKLVTEAQFSAGETHQVQWISSIDQCPVYADTDLLQHVLSNLLSNAIKYSPQGGTVSLSLAIQDQSIQLQVKDSGIGIPIADQKNLFESFHRAENVGKIPGTGLGLSIVKQCVELHGGQISVLSQPQQGTTFTVLIPLQTPTTNPGN